MADSSPNEDFVLFLENGHLSNNCNSIQAAITNANQTGLTIKSMPNTYTAPLADFATFRTKYPQFNNDLSFISIQPDNTVIFQLRQVTL